MGACDGSCFNALVGNAEGWLGAGTTHLSRLELWIQEGCGAQLALHGSLSREALNVLDHAFCMCCILQTLLLYLEPSKHRFSASLAAKYILVTSFRPS